MMIVLFSLYQWHCQWVENGIHRIRAFKASYGVKKTKLAAEKFRRDLEACGRYRETTYGHKGPIVHLV